MACCEPTTIQFINQAQTQIVYTDALKKKYGSRPSVFVWQLDTTTGQYTRTSWFTTVTLGIGDVITVDHGGANQNGFVVIT